MNVTKPFSEKYDHVVLVQGGGALGRTRICELVRYFYEDVALIPSLSGKSCSPFTWTARS